MFAQSVTWAAIASLALQANALSKKQWHKRSDHVYLPKETSDYKTALAPNNVTVRYKNPGICETTPGVDSYSGYVDLTPDVHVFYWFFESRNKPSEDPFTLWLNGGPGSDSLIGLFEENGPCMLTENLTTSYNPYSWNNVSNMLYISQPVGTGFSYQKQGVGSVNPWSSDFHYNSTEWPATGRYPILEPLNIGTIDTTDLAAMATWHVLQALLNTIPKFDTKIGTPREFNLFTESYGGHYGPAFFHYFYNQNLRIQNGSMPGYPLNFNSLGIINGIIDESVQAEYYPEFAVNNTYGIKAYNDTVYSYAKFANNMYNGCLDQIKICRAAAEGNASYYHVDAPITNAELTPGVLQICNEAADMCRDNVESPYYYYSGRGVYDIRNSTTIQRHLLTILTISTCLRCRRPLASLLITRAATVFTMLSRTLETLSIQTLDSIWSICSIRTCASVWRTVMLITSVIGSVVRPSVLLLTTPTARTSGLLATRQWWWMVLSMVKCASTATSALPASTSLDMKSLTISLRPLWLTSTAPCTTTTSQQARRRLPEI